MRGHKHYLKTDPKYDERPFCVYKTKKECDAAMSAWKREAKARVDEAKVAKIAAAKAAREMAYLEYEASERARIARILAQQQGGAT